MRRAHLSQLLVAAGAVIGLVTVRDAGGGGSIWSAAEPYALHAALGATAGAVAAVLLALLWPGGPPARPAARQPIPERVRHEVWRRDRGSCVECGSRARLPVDPIIPGSRGGAKTPPHPPLPRPA